MRIRIFISIFLIFCLNSCGDISTIEENNRNKIKRLKSEEIEKILIYDDGSKKYKGYLKRPLAVITNNKKISAFSDAFKSLVAHHPNHPRYIKEWYMTIDLLNGEDEDLIVMLENGDSKNLYIVCLGHRWLGGGGTSKSDKLLLVFKDNGIIK